MSYGDAEDAACRSISESYESLYTCVMLNIAFITAFCLYLTRAMRLSMLTGRMPVNKLRVCRCVSEWGR